jgi:hypothetical protein
MTPEQIKRFWAKVDKSGECWLWTGAKNGGGYGVIAIDGKNHVAHRLALGMKLGRPVRRDRLACHRCSTRACVRPGHIYEGTPLDNSWDMRDREARDPEVRERHRRNRSLAKLALARTA